LSACCQQVIQAHLAIFATSAINEIHAFGKNHQTSFQLAKSSWPANLKGLQGDEDQRIGNKSKNLPRSPRIKHFNVSIIVKKWCNILLRSELFYFYKSLTKRFQKRS
jgi:hypothetical protein